MNANQPATQEHQRSSSAPFRLPAPGEDWTAVERAELDRLCTETGLTLEAGRSDEGDSWCVVHDETMIIAHIARIGQTYIMHRMEHEQVMRVVSIKHAVSRVLASG